MMREFNVAFSQCLLRNYQLTVDTLQNLPYANFAFVNGWPKKCHNCFARYRSFVCTVQSSRAIRSHNY